MTTSPVFLFSLPRSGSTLLQRMLSCHPEINTKSELWFLLPHVEALRNKYTFSQYSNISLRNAVESLVDQLPGGEGDYYRSIRALSDTLYESLAKNNERYVLDKTPRYYLIIEEIVKIYPDAKCIFLFRNPLSIIGSVVESFNRGKLGDYRHKIDLYLGPKMLAEGYAAVRDRSHVVYYEDLVSDPSNIVERVCDYLDLEYYPDMIENFAKVSVGKMGDQFGSNKFKKLAPDRAENWRRVFSTTFRKRYLQKYLEEIGRDAIEEMGYDYAGLISDVKGMDANFSLGLIDRIDLAMCSFISAVDWMLFKEKLFKLRKNQKRFILVH